jgi:hypothetical protein
MRFTGRFESEQQAAIEFAHVDINNTLAYIERLGRPLVPKQVELVIETTNQWHSKTTLCWLLEFLKAQVATLSQEIGRFVAFEDCISEDPDSLLSEEVTKTAQLVQLTTAMQTYLEEIAFIRRCLMIRMRQEISPSAP